MSQIKRQKFTVTKTDVVISLPYNEMMNVLNRAQELIILNYENDNDRRGKCLVELELALSKLGKVAPELPIDPELDILDGGLK